MQATEIPAQIRDERLAVLRQFVWFFLPAAAMLLAMVSTGAYLYAQNQVHDQLLREEAEVFLASDRIRQDMREVSVHLNTLADLLDGSPAQASNTRQVAEIFRVFARNTGLYDQVRLLDAHGMERVRVDFNEGEPVVVPEAQLQDQSTHDDFREASRLMRGEMYVSPLDLYVENAHTAVPDKPTLRFAMPLFDARGHRWGIVVLNYLGANMLDRFRAALGRDGCQGMLLNSEGYWLVSPSRQDEWGFMFGDPRTFANTYPDAWSKLVSQPQGSFRNERGLFVFATIYPLQAGQYSSQEKGRGENTGGRGHEAYSWKIVSMTPAEDLPSGWFFRQPVMWWSLLLVLLLFAGVASALAKARVARVRWAAALGESEVRYRSLVANLPGIAYRCAMDADWTVKIMSGSVMAMTGYAADEFLSRARSYASVIHPDDRERVAQVVEDGVKAQRAFELEYRVCRQDGETVVVHEKGHGVFDSRGQLLWLDGFIWEVTEHKRAEMALREAESFKQGILDAISTHVAVLGRDGYIMAVNRPWRVFAQENGGLDSATARHTDVGTNYLQICREAQGEYAEDAQEVLAGITAVLAGRLPVFTYDYPCHSPQQHRWFSMTVAPLSGASGGAVISHVDITAPSMLAEELRTSEMRFRLLFENAPIGIAMANNERRLLRVNRALADMLGYSEADLVGKTFDEITHPDDIADNVDRFQQAVQNPSPGYHLRKRYLHRDGHAVWANLFSSPIRASNGKVLYSVGMMENITERVNAEAERLAHEASQRNALVREVHHRIKNNLHGVMALLRQDMVLFPEAAIPLESAIAQINTISVIYGLQSRLGERALPLEKLLGEIVKVAASLAMAEVLPLTSIGLRGHIGLERNATVAVALILNELVQNAFKHGVIDRGDDIEISLFGDAETVHIHIRNPGGPLPAGFNPAAKGGCGIGLDLVRTLLPRKGARLNIVDEPGYVRAELVLAPPIIVLLAPN